MTFLAIVEPHVLEARRKKSERHRRKKGARPHVPVGPTKTCPKCGVEKDREADFFQTMRRGKLVAVGYCKPCAAETGKYRNWARKLISNAEQRHKKRWMDEPFDLDVEFLFELLERQGGRCAWFGVELCLTPRRGYREPAQVSLDRVDPSQGYSKKNVLLACQAANLARCDTPAEAFSVFVEVMFGRRE